MNIDKVQLENNISRVALDIFSICQDRNDECSDFRTLKIKLADMLWRWASLTFNSFKLKNAGVEVMKCISRSISSYKGDANKYINYIAVAISQEIKRANAQLSIEEKNIICLPEKKYKMLSKLISVAEQYGKNIDKSTTQQWLSKVFGYSVEKIRELFIYKKQIEVKKEWRGFEDNDAYSIFDNAEIYMEYNEIECLSFLNVENIQHDIHIVIKNIEAMFLQEKENTKNQLLSKKYIAALLTRQILEELDASKYYEYSEILSLIREQAFCDESILKFFVEGVLPTQAEIAKAFGKDKTDASRKLRQFIEKLEKNCQHR